MTTSNTELDFTGLTINEWGLNIVTGLIENFIPLDKFLEALDNTILLSDDFIHLFFKDRDNPEEVAFEMIVDHEYLESLNLDKTKPLKLGTNIIATILENNPTYVFAVFILVILPVGEDEVVRHLILSYDDERKGFILVLQDDEEA